MQDVDEERVVLEEVVNLQSAAVTDPEVRKKFAVVGCKEDGIEITHTLPISSLYLYTTGDNLIICSHILTFNNTHMSNEP